MSAKHGVPIRGLMSVPHSRSFQGRFGRMFRSLSPAQFGRSEGDNTRNLHELAELLSNELDDPKDEKDDEESGIPALYTYFGQFVDHDITFDPSSTLQKQNDPNALIDYRTPAFDLDNVYGRGPDDQPYMYDGSAFLLGNKLSGGDASSTDLPRNNAKPSRALIGDPRNDENSIISQLQGLFLRFHNRALADNPRLPFEDIQRLVRFHYQYVVMTDFLPRIVTNDVLDQLKSGGLYDPTKLRFFTWRNEPFMPVEFSVAAYRLGHSMIRPGYRLNDTTLLPIFPTANFPEGLTGFRSMNPNWGIDWGRFIDIDNRIYDGSAAENQRRLQFAYRIDTSLVNPLHNLPDTVVSDRPPSLGERNLLRGWRLGLPSGQAVARAMGLQPLTDDKILIGAAVEKPAKALPDITAAPEAFKGNCPLWVYILAEAMQNKTSVKLPVKESVQVNTPQLGPVGGRIVAEVFLGLLSGDKASYLNLDPSWQPKTGPDYKLKDFVLYALGK
jgi:hypothetical protein